MNRILVGWWWADPVEWLALAYVADREGIEHCRADGPDEWCP